MSRVRLKSISDESYELKENKFYLFCLDEAVEAELVSFSKTLADAKVNAVVTNFTFKSVHELDLKELINLRDALENTIDVFYKKMSVKNPDRFEILKQT